MDGALVHLINDPCTPESMAKAKVPFDLATWYHLYGSRLSYYLDEELRKVMKVRSMVRQMDTAEA
jgi:hypothetical protein